MNFPPKVAAAVAQVMSGVKTLKKDQENQHARYKFAGIDDFLEATRPLCAEAGLIIIQDEDGFDVVGDGWLMMRYSFHLAHSSGEMWEGAIRRTIMVQAKMGSQAFGAAQSYVLKQFMRSLFQMATGDGEDADSHEQRDLPKTDAKTRASGGVRKSSRQAKEDGDHVRIKAEIEACMTERELDGWYAKFDEKTAALPFAWLDSIRDMVESRRNDIIENEKEAA